MEVQSLDERTLSIIILGSGGALLLSASMIFFFFRYQRKTQLQKEQLLKAELEFKQQLLYANIRSQEEERVRLSKELHDHVGGTLSVLRFMIDQFDPSQATKPADQEQIATYKDMMDGVIDDVRHISHAMAPPGLALWGLQEAMAALCEKISKSSEKEIRVDCKDPALVKQLPFDHALALYRVIQELITNTLKHASAQTIAVVMDKKDDELSIVYRDDGVGAGTDLNTTKGTGIQNIENRLMMIGATHTVKTGPGQGFLLTMYVPVKQNINMT
jgi:signal transduction histidine kinase